MFSPISPVTTGSQPLARPQFGNNALATDAPKTDADVADGFRQNRAARDAADRQQAIEEGIPVLRLLRHFETRSLSDRAARYETEQDDYLAALAQHKRKGALRRAFSAEPAQPEAPNSWITGSALLILGDIDYSQIKELEGLEWHGLVETRTVYFDKGKAIPVPMADSDDPGTRLQAKVPRDAQLHTQYRLTKAGHRALTEAGFGPENQTA